MNPLALGAAFCVSDTFTAIVGRIFADSDDIIRRQVIYAVSHSMFTFGTASFLYGLFLKLFGSVEIEPGQEKDLPNTQKDAT